MLLSRTFDNPPSANLINFLTKLPYPFGAVTTFDEF